MKEMVLDGFRYDQPTPSGWIIKKELAEAVVDKYIKEYVNTNRAFGEIGPVSDSVIQLRAVSHIIKELYWEGDQLKAKVQLMDSDTGKILQMFDSSKLKLTYRGVGRLVNNYIQNDFVITAFDISAKEESFREFPVHASSI